jgi:hypothetical protein
MKRLIGVAGRARSGKDEFTRGLVAQGYIRGAFADALKEATALLAGEPVENFFDEVAKEAHSPALRMTRRKALQKVGTSMRDTLHPDIWVERTLAQAHGAPQFAISDCRYTNEAQAIRDAGGIVVVIERPGNAGLTGEAAAHVSEAPLPDELVDLTITNSGSVEDLHACARLVAHYLRTERAVSLSDYLGEHTP